MLVLAVEGESLKVSKGKLGAGEMGEIFLNFYSSYLHAHNFSSQNIPKKNVADATLIRYQRNPSRGSRISDWSLSRAVRD